MRNTLFFLLRIFIHYFEMISIMDSVVSKRNKRLVRIAIAPMEYIVWVF